MPERNQLIRVVTLPRTACTRAAPTRGRWPRPGWPAGGPLRAVEDVWEGIDAAPGALIDLLAGGDLGKRMVSVGGEG